MNKTTFHSVYSYEHFNVRPNQARGNT